jgi:hypothetical protein
VQLPDVAGALGVTGIEASENLDQRILLLVHDRFELRTARITNESDLSSRQSTGSGRCLERWESMQEPAVALPLTRTRMRQPTVMTQPSAERHSTIRCPLTGRFELGEFQRDLGCFAFVSGETIERSDGVRDGRLHALNRTGVRPLRQQQTQ